VFESVRPDPGPDGLTRAARIFYVVAVMSAAASVVFLVFALMGDTRYTPFRLSTDFGSAALAFVTGRGIENQRRWAKWLGYGFGVLELINIPIGTVIGAAAILYIHRADKAGLFA
jgi:hypothetical protein